MDGHSNCTADTVLEYSTICLDIDHPAYDEASCNTLHLPLSRIAVIICIFNGLVGCCGNLLTLLAIPYAIHHKCFGFKTQRDPTTLFILNLALADLLYCCVNLPLYAIQYLNVRWPFGETMCIACALFRHANAYSEWMCLAVIAMTRCLGLVRNKPFFTWRQGYAVILCIWIYPIILLLPIITQRLGKLGYNCRNGKCDFIPLETDWVEPHVFFYGVSFGVPCLVILVSYTIIWCYARNSARYIRQTSKENRRNVAQREYNMTCTLFLICLCYLMFVMPIAMVNIVDPLSNYPDLHLAFFCIYWFQYSLNFLIYAARCHQYRKAYIFFLSQFGFFCQRPSTPALVLTKERPINGPPRPWPATIDKELYKFVKDSLHSTMNMSVVCIGPKPKRDILAVKRTSHLGQGELLPHLHLCPTAMPTQALVPMRLRSHTL